MKSIRQTILNDYKTCAFMCLSNWGEHGEETERKDTGNKYSEVGLVVHEVMEEWTNNRCLEALELSLHDLADEKLNSIPEELFKDSEEIEVYRESIHEQLDWLFDQTRSNEIIGSEISFDCNPCSLISEIDLPITGTIDRIDGNLDEKRAIIMDYKTGKPYTKKSLKTNVQALLYSMAFHQMYGFLPEKFVFVFSKAKKTMTIYITPEFLKEAGNEVLSIWFNIKQGNFEANNKNAFFCKNFCQSKNECPKFKPQNKEMKQGWKSLL